MGSLALCDAIYDGSSTIDSSSSSSSTASKDNSSANNGNANANANGNGIGSGNGNRNNGLPFAEAYAEAYSSVYNAPPPFLPGFYVLKLQLNETMPTQVVSRV